MNENRLAFLESSISAIHDAWIVRFGSPPDAQSMHSHLQARLQHWDLYVGGASAATPAAGPAQLPLPPPVVPMSSNNPQFNVDNAIASAEAAIGRPLTPEERAQYAAVRPTHDLGPAGVPPVTPRGL